MPVVLLLCVSHKRDVHRTVVVVSFCNIFERVFLWPTLMQTEELALYFYSNNDKPAMCRVGGLYTQCTYCMLHSLKAICSRLPFCHLYGHDYSHQNVMQHSHQQSLFSSEQSCSTMYLQPCAPTSLMLPEVLQSRSSSFFTGVFEESGCYKYGQFLFVSGHLSIDSV